MIYLQLFLSFLQVGMFSFGGGYAALPLIQGQVVKTHSWLSMSEFTDLITISQMTPGPIAVNSLRPAVVALIASAGISILITAFWGNDMITFAGTNWGLVTIFVICIFLIQKVIMNPVWVMLLAGVMKVGVSCAQRL